MLQRYNNVTTYSQHTHTLIFTCVMHSVKHRDWQETFVSKHLSRFSLLLFRNKKHILSFVLETKKWDVSGSLKGSLLPKRIRNQFSFLDFSPTNNRLYFLFRNKSRKFETAVPKQKVSCQPLVKPGSRFFFGWTIFCLLWKNFNFSIKNRDISRI